MTPDVVVIGVGNLYRRDDGVGVEVLRRLEELAAGGIRLVESDGEPADIIEIWAGARLAVVVDAVRGMGAPGSVHRWETPAGGPGMATTADLGPSRPAIAATHSLGIGHALALGAAVDRLPRHLVVIGVEAGDLGMGPGLSPPVAAAAETVARSLLDTLGVMAEAG